MRLTDRAVAFVLTILGVPSWSSADDLITAIDETRMLAILACENPERTFGTLGANYHLRCDSDGRARGMQRVSVAVHVSIDAAKAAIQESASWVAAGITVEPRPGLGDECWHSGGSINFRRRNVTVGAVYLSDIDAALHSLRRIDRMIQNDRDFAPLGQFATVPRFTDPAIPSTLVSDQPVFVNPQFEGLVSPDTVRVFIMRNTRPGSQPKEPQGYRISERGEPGERLRFQVFAVDENNVVIQSEPVQVTIVASP